MVDDAAGRKRAPFSAAVPVRRSRNTQSRRAVREEAAQAHAHYARAVGLDAGNMNIASTAERLLDDALRDQPDDVDCARPKLEMMAARGAALSRPAWPMSCIAGPVRHQ